MTLWRSRWAAIGAAIAVTLGAGGLFAAQAADDVSVFVPVTPTRVLDARAATNIGLAGKFTTGVSRKLTLTGTIDTDRGNQLVVPTGATAVVYNVTVIAPTHRGFVSVRPGNATGTPSTSSVNIAAGTIAGNGGTVTLPTSGSGSGKVDIFYKGAVAGATADIVLDVTGYYTPAAGASVDGVAYLTSPFSIIDGDFGQAPSPACAAGQFAVAAGLDPNWPTPAPFDPGPDALVYTSHPDPTMQFRRWIVEFSNTTGEDLETTLYTVCVAVAP